MSVFRRLTSVLMVSAVLAVLVFYVSHTLAQDPTVPSRRAPAISRDMRYREWILKELEKKGKKVTPGEELNWKQIRDDFRSIQLESKFLRETAANDPIDLKAVETSAGKIQKIANRLKSNLLLPQPEIEEKARQNKVDEVGMQTLVSALDGVIRRFVTNPTFDESAVLEIELAIKAGHDLDRVIDLSRAVKKKAAH